MGRLHSELLDRRRFLRVAGVGIGSAVFASCKAERNTLVYGLQNDLDDTMDPQVTLFDVTIRVTLNICEPLVWEPQPGRFVPGLAESWEISPDARTYTFRLKKK